MASLRTEAESPAVGPSARRFAPDLHAGLNQRRSRPEARQGCRQDRRRPRYFRVTRTRTIRPGSPRAPAPSRSRPHEGVNGTDARRQARLLRRAHQGEPTDHLPRLEEDPDSDLRARAGVSAGSTRCLGANPLSHQASGMTGRVTLTSRTAAQHWCRRLAPGSPPPCSSAGAHSAHPGCSTSQTRK